MGYQQEMARLRDQLELAQEELASKNDVLLSIAAQEQHFPPDWGLSEKERRILGALTRKGMASQDQLITAMYWDVYEADWPGNAYNVMTVKLSWLRKKMAAQDIVIPNFHGGQLALQHDALVRLRTVLQFGIDPKSFKSQKRPEKADKRQMSLFADNINHEQEEEEEDMALAS